MVPRHHPLATRQEVSFADTLSYDYIGLSAQTSLARRLKEESERLGRPLKLRIQVRGFDSICRMAAATQCVGIRPEEHTSELQSLMRISYAVFCLKKKKTPLKIATVITQHIQ